MEEMKYLDFIVYLVFVDVIYIRFKVIFLLHYIDVYVIYIRSCVIVDCMRMALGCVVSSMCMLLTCFMWIVLVLVSDVSWWVSVYTWHEQISSPYTRLYLASSFYYFFILVVYLDYMLMACWVYMCGICKLYINDVWCLCWNSLSFVLTICL